MPTVQEDIVSLKLYAPSDPTTNQSASDIIIVDGSSGLVDNWTSIHMEKDFFTPADGITIVIEDDRATEYIHYLQRGNRIDIFLNYNLNMSGYIFDYQYEYDRGSTKLTLQCKDLLEYMAQGSIFPNFGSGDTTNFHFPPTSTLRQCCETIVNSFTLFLKNQNTLNSTFKVVVGDNDPRPGKGIGDLSLATGFAVGLRAKGKKPKQFTKSINAALNRLNTPEKGETYLGYLSRLVKLSGAYVKMSPGSNDTIVVQAPTYDRDKSTPFSITHLLNPKNNENNVKQAMLKFSLDKQPSVVIIEGNSMSEDFFYLKDEKAIAVNELTGYALASLPDFTTGQSLPILPAIAFAVGNLVDTSRGAAGSGTNYSLNPINIQLYQQRYNLAVDINTSVSLPLYEVSRSAHNTDQLSFEAAQRLAEEQDKYVEFTYRIQGWTQNNAVWQPNMLVNVTEEALSPGKPIKTTMWIRKVNYIKDRTNGTCVDITCILPYTHNFELSEDINPTSASQNTGYKNLSLAALIAAARNSALNNITFTEQNLQTPDEDI